VVVQFVSLQTDTARRLSAGSLALEPAFIPNISIVGEFSGHSDGSDYVHKPSVRSCGPAPRCAETYVPSVRVYEYLFGPRFRLEVDDRHAIFVHAGRRSESKHRRRRIRSPLVIPSPGHIRRSGSEKACRERGSGFFLAGLLEGCVNCSDGAGSRKTKLSW
jgi:hypothetical protein